VETETFEYREPINMEELEDLFSLRYSIYKYDRLLNSMLFGMSHDFNSYDTTALHFGAFHNGKAIAYMRLTLDRETHQTEHVKTLMHKFGIPVRKKKHRFPFQHYYPDQDWSDSFLTELQGKKIGEVGRLSIHPDYRNGGILLDNMFSAFISYCKSHEVKIGFGSCTLLLERYYRKFGFQRAENCSPFVYKNLPEAVIVCFDGVSLTS
jgi:GNAT superfamily N-acetyltransferase